MTGLMLLLVAAGGVTVYGASPDHMVVVVNSTNATNGASIAAYGYNPTDDSMYTCGYTAGAMIRRVTNVANPAAQVSTIYVGTDPWLMFMKAGNWNNGSGTPTIGSMLPNPKTIYDADGTTPLYPAYSQACIADQATACMVLGIPDWSLTQKFYFYNMQPVPAAADPPPPYGDGRDVFTSLVTVQEMGDAIGFVVTGTTTGGVSNQRQVAYSSDGQSIYFNDSASIYGGIWKVRARDGYATRIYQDTTSSNINCEPGVVHTSVRRLNPANPTNGDQIIFAGKLQSGNPGGMDYLLDDGTTITGPFPFLTGAQLRAFEESATDSNVNAVAVDSEGNIYMDDWNAASRALIRYDKAGRLVKMKSKAEHLAFTAANGTGTNVATKSLQFRTVRDPSNTFDVLQAMFLSVSLKAVGGITLYKPCDFDRDNALTAADVMEFNAMLALGPTAPATTDPNYTRYLRCDLNGNASVTATDYAILKTFFPGDFDLDGDCDLEDFSTFQSCFNGPNRPAKDPVNCTDTDFDKDSDVDLADFSEFQGCFNGPNRPFKCG